jgi:hypothetical protein
MEIMQSLRPLSIGELLDRAFRLFRSRFWQLTGIAALSLLPMTGLQLLAQLAWMDTRVADLAQSFLVLPLVQGCLAAALACAHLGQPSSIGEAYRSGLRRYWVLWGASLLQGLAIGSPIVLLSCGAFALGTGGWALICLAVLVIPYAAFLSTRWAVTVPGIMQEELGATGGLRRSWSLTAEDFWRVLGVTLLANLLAFFVAELPGLAIAYGLPYVLPDAQIGPMLQIVTTGLSLILTLPLSMGVTVLLYYDLRVRREGYDMEIQAGKLAADHGVQPS